ncbi:hypothetical protein FACS189454_04310 [Planctomycetales bacterium]|nr:hypothetical protein FACS189454_04310 [Planctomycetales bacterium]
MKHKNKETIQVVYCRDCVYGLLKDTSILCTCKESRYFMIYVAPKNHCVEGVDFMLPPPPKKSGKEKK